MHFTPQRSLPRVPVVFGRRTPRFVLALAVVLSIGAFAAAQRRDFPATYTVTHVSADSGGVALTLTLSVRNYSGENIEDCGIVLNGSDMFSTPIGSFAPVKLLPSYGEITVRRRFTVPNEEYVRWHQGIDPSLAILLPDGRGGTRVEKIDARREAPLADPAE